MKIVLILIPLLLLVCDEIHTSIAVTVSPTRPNFYPFGESEGDGLLPKNDDESSGSVSISIPFPYFDQYHKSLFVNTNGVISFVEQVSQYTPDTFPLDGNRRLVAPFWADVDTRKGGDVFYRETTDPNLLQQATDQVAATYVNQQNFRATWLFIATWNEVAFFGASNSSLLKRNTFQAVLITNGRHAFVIFNYRKITWTTGTESDTPAQAGFNAGDGKRYFNIPGSATDQVMFIGGKSNVGKPGQWMFRIDNAKIEAGGCNTKGSLVVSPRSVSMLGGDNLMISGPCYKPTDRIVCKFPDGTANNGSYISNIRASCTVPMLFVTGKLEIQMSLNGGRSFDFKGSFTTVNINRIRPRVSRLSPATWMEDVLVRVTWKPDHLGSENQTVAIKLARFAMKHGRVHFHSVYSLKAKQQNTGEAGVSVPKGQGQGAVVGHGRYVTLVLVKKTGVRRDNSPAEWIWSDLFSWISYKWGAKRCTHWYNRQPNPRNYTDDPSLLPCPQTFLQATADRGRFTMDEYCNPKVEDGCVIYHPGAKHCFRTITPSNQGAGQQCCYNEKGNLMVGPQNGGSLDRVHIAAGVPVLSHFFHDLLPYWDCCVLSDNCAKYFEKRPSDDGSKYEPPRPATGFGDPHMITLDGVEYTFNGYGEYEILKVAGPDFTLQGRMQPLINDDGSKSRATVYKAFAMKENASDVVQVLINGRNEMEFLVNGDQMEFNEELMMDFEGVIIIKYNNTSKYSAIFGSGISVTVEKAEDILQMMLLVPPMFKGNTSGLLGFWDGDQEKELLLPNGTFLETTSSQNRIHYEFGRLWATTANNSLFTYDEGKSHSSYFDAGYVPIFLDQDDMEFDNATLGQQARDVCGNNKQCLFDIHTTGKISIGMASKQALESFVAVINETETAGCIPLDNTLGNGTALRNDTTDGGIIYEFHCHPGFLLNGSSVISCFQGQWNDSKPSCRQTDQNGAVTARVEGIKATEIPCEHNALGAAEGGQLSSVDFKASSSYPDFSPFDGRLNGPLAWCSLGYTAGEEYLQIHVPEAESICAIATQGTGYIEGDEYVTEYHVTHSEDGSLWKEIEEEPGKMKLFEGNRDSKSVSRQVLAVPVEAAYIRIYPLQYYEWMCMRIELYGREKTPRAPFPAVAEAESSTVTPPLPTSAVKTKGMDVGILIDSSSGVTADEFKRLKSFILRLVKSINKKFSNVHFGIIVYSDKPDLVMSLQNVDRIEVKSIIDDVKYNPGGHRTDLAMLHASQKLFCPRGCKDRPEVENVLIVFTSEKTDAESLPYSLVSPIMKNCTSNIVAVGTSHDVSTSELIKIALGTPDHALQVKSPDHLNSGVISKIEGVLTQSLSMDDLDAWLSEQM